MTALTMIEGPKLVLSILIIVSVTFFTRAFPFLLFDKEGKTPPKVILYLGKYLPPAIISAILIYCLRNVSFSQFFRGQLEIIAVVVVVLLHVWKRNSLISIFGGTGIYMILKQFIFM